MLRNYFKTALRNLWRQKANTILNISGLTIGIASCLVLFILIWHHSSYDQFHSRKDRIYRIVTESDGNNGRRYTAGIPPVLPAAFKNDFPEAEEVCFISYRAGSLISIPQNQGEGKKFSEKKGVTFAEPTFFKIFDRKVLLGEAVKSLSDPNTAVISSRSALKYFGKEDAVGEVIKFDKREYKVTAIMENCPSNTDFPFDVIFSMVTIQKERDEVGWHSIWSDEHCYFLLKENVNVQELKDRMGAFYTKYYTEENKSHQEFAIQPLGDIHFDDRYDNFNYNNVSREMLMSLSLIALFLVITACINFVNITTAEAVKRSREVGIRKSLGSTRWQLIRQFLGETTLVTSVAMFLALILTSVGLTFLNPFLDLDLSINFLSDKTIWLFVVGVAAGVSLLSGFYPSWVVSGYQVTQAIKNQFAIRNSSGLNLRRGLVILQFFISQFFIIGTIVLISQMNYFRNKELGFRKDAIISIPIPVNETPLYDKGTGVMRSLRNEIGNMSGVELVSLCNTPPSSGSTSGTRISIEGYEEEIRAQVKLIDDHYLDLFELKLLAGKNIQDLDTAQGFLVNERLAIMAGYENYEDILGKRIKCWGKDLPVTGVVRDFHTVSLRSPIEATILFNRIRSYETLSIRINPTSTKNVVEQVKKRWEAAYPEYIFSYLFMDDEIREFYENEGKMTVLLGVFTSLAIFIGCLGLFGLTTFMAIQKTKEIGVRKVLGASVSSILVLFSREFIILIGLGFLLAAPVSFFVMNQWLNNFAYKIELGPWIFFIGIALTLFIAMITVGYRSYRAAAINPAESLKSD